MRAECFCPIRSVSPWTESVSDYIHALGLKAGIYSDAGANTCGSIYNGEKTGIGIGFYQHEFQDAKRFLTIGTLISLR